jgi:cytochrome P450
MKEYLEAAILDRHASPRDDVLSEIVHAQVERDGELRLDYLRAEAGLLLAGGFVTTAHMIASAMLLLLRHPDAHERVRADRSLIKKLLEEALRVESPVQWQPRVTTVDTEVAGVEIPAGSLVLVLLAAANRDDAAFAAADELDLGRPASPPHVAFGYGTHFCLGAPLGRLEGRIAFERLLTRLGAIRLAEGQEAVTSLESTIFRGPKALHLTFERAA